MKKYIIMLTEDERTCYTPKHGSWLNIAEIERWVLNGQGLDRRIRNVRVMKRETSAWEAERHVAEATVNWRFTTVDARIKLKRLYSVTQPDPATSNSAKRQGAKLAGTDAALRARHRAHKKIQTQR